MRRAGATAAVAVVVPAAATGGWGMGRNGRGSAGKGWPRGLRLGSEDPRQCVRVGGGQAGLGLRLVGLWAKGGSESCFYLVVVG